MNTLKRLLPTMLLSASCGGPTSEPPGERPEPLAPYVAPTARLDPQTADQRSTEFFHKMGLDRSGLRGRGTSQQTPSTRYVSARDGRDDGDGTEGSPWRTLQQAADQVQPGTTVLVDDSAPYEGGLSIEHGGERGAWVIFKNRDADKAPKLVGGIDRDAVVDIRASFIVLQGFEISGHQRAAGADTIGIQIEASDDHLSNIEIRNNVIHDIGPGVIDENACYYNGHGIIAQSEGKRISDLIVDGNELHSLYVGHSECLVLNGYVEHFRVTNNFVHDVNNIAIDIIGYEKNDRETTKHGLIADNVVLDASNYWPYCSRGNCAYPVGDESSDGIYVDGGAELIIEYNVVGRADHGIELQSENGQLIRNVEVRHNAVFNSHYKNFTLGDHDGSSEHSNNFFDAPHLSDPSHEGCQP